MRPCLLKGQGLFLAYWVIFFICYFVDMNRDLIIWLLAVSADRCFGVACYNLQGVEPLEAAACNHTLLFSIFNLGQVERWH